MLRFLFSPNAMLRLSPGIIAALWIGITQHIPFFWDTIQLASKHAHFFYENHLQWAALPPDMDSGHPPLLGYYLAVCWTFLGKSLAVSHWAMFPFLAILLHQIARVGTAISPKWGWLLVPIVGLDPVFLGQASLVSPDILVLTGLFLGINGLHNRQWPLFMAGGLLLCTASMRGMMCAAALGVWALWSTPGHISAKIKAALPLAPGALAGLAFLVWHHRATGWIGHFEGSTWAGAFERVDAKGLVRNIAILGWRWLDMNRFWVWGLLLFVALRTGLPVWYRRHRIWVQLFVCLVIFLTPSALIYQNLSAHRYFLPIFAALNILAFSAIEAYSFSRKNTQRVVLAGMLLLGNCWTYPRGVSMDWDSTLAHLPYHHLRQQAQTWLDDQGVDWATVGTSFPNLNTNEHILLNDDQRIMQPVDFEQNTWIMTSNVLNDIDEPEYAVLTNDWLLVQRFGGWPVWIELYKKR